MDFFKRNKIVSFLLSILFLAVSYESYTFFVNRNSIDRNTYFEVIEWKWKIKRLEDNILVSWWEWKIEVFPWDTLSTLTPKSLWIITWWDWSLTRIWWRSQIIIDESDVSSDLSKINIKFSLLDGKSWSNVISLMWDNSYFKQEFRWYVAWVRWTVFEVNLDKEYVFAKDHSVEVVSKDKSEKYIIKHWEVFSISLLKLIWDKIREKTWEAINDNLDVEYLKELYVSLKESYAYQKKSIIESFDKTKDISSKIISWEVDISNLLASNLLTPEQEKELYNNIFYEYQKLNFVKPWEEWFTRKMFLKWLLFSMWWGKNEKQLISSTVYDFIDASKTSVEDAKFMADFISQNSISGLDFLDSLRQNISIKSLSPETNQNIKTSLKNSSENFNAIFWDNIELLNQIFSSWVSISDSLDIIKDINFSDIDKISESANKATESFLQKIFNKK